MPATLVHEISTLKYHLISDWMRLNDFIINPTDSYIFEKKEDNLIVQIVSNKDGDHSFMILFKDTNGDQMSSFTGDLNLPTLLGYLIWHNLITNYKISK